MLKPGDGFPAGRSEFKAEVIHLQSLMRHAGHTVTRDGFYGPQTEAVIRDLQEKYGLPVTGFVDQATWQAVEKEVFSSTRKADSPETPAPEGNSDPAEKEDSWKDFHGRLDWIHQQEGHAGKPYWPGGESGITLDPGFDLGHQDADTAAAYYTSILTPAQLSSLNAVIGERGRKAKSILNQSSELLAIRITRSQASEVFPRLALPYWLAICRRMPALKQAATPGAVQTAFLSLAYNRGYNNQALSILELPVRESDWHRCADLIGNMQQDHVLPGIRLRRQREADLILTSVS